MRKLVLVVAIVGVLVGAACSGKDNNNAQEEDEKSRNKTVAELIESQPIEPMDYSPSRETINHWIRTWGKEPGKLSYVYLLSADGTELGYYILEGLPVSYCASGTRNYQVRDDDNGNVVTPAPGVDGVWYSGGQCDVYYGKDATSGTYVEWSVGLGISQLVYSEPFDRFAAALPLGDATFDSVGAD